MRWTTSEFRTPLACRDVENLSFVGELHGEDLRTTQAARRSPHRVWKLSPKLSTAVYNVPLMGDRETAGCVQASQKSLVTGHLEAKRLAQRGLLDPSGDLGNLVENASPLAEKLTNFAVCVHHCGVIPPAKELTNLGK